MRPQWWFEPQATCIQCMRDGTHTKTGMEFSSVFSCTYAAVTFLWLRKGVYSFNTISLCMYSHHLSNYSYLSLGISLDILSHYSSILCLSPSSLHLSQPSISSSSTHMCHSVIYHWLFIACIMSWTNYIVILCTCKVFVLLFCLRLILIWSITSSH